MPIFYIDIESSHHNQLTCVLTIKAKDWYAALSEGLSQQKIDGGIPPRLLCIQHFENSVTAFDPLYKRTFRINSFEAETSIHNKFASRLDTSISNTKMKAEICEEFIFDKNAVKFHERVLSISNVVVKQDLADIAEFHFAEVLKNYSEDQDLFVSLHILVLSDKKKFRFPPVLSLNYQSWNSDKPKIIFPLLGEEGLFYNRYCIDNYEVFNRIIPTENKKHSKIKSKLVDALIKTQNLFSITDKNMLAEHIILAAKELIQSTEGRCLMVTPLNNEIMELAASFDTDNKEQLKNQSLEDSPMIEFSLKNHSTISVLKEALICKYKTKGQCILCTPIEYGDCLFGVLELTKTNSEEGFSEDDSLILSYLATFFAERLTIIGNNIR